MELDVAFFLLLVLVILLAAAIFGLFVYSGLSYSPSVETGPPPLGPSKIAYRYLVGPYNSNFVSVAYEELAEAAPTATTLGIFYDDPNEVDHAKLRCAVGCVADSLSAEEVAALRERDFQFFELPEVEDAVQTEFPYKTFLSSLLAPNRVYPRLGDFIASRGLCAYPMIEIYETRRIRYMVPLSKQEDYFVPETTEEEIEEDDRDEARDPESVEEMSGSDESSSFEQIRGEEVEEEEEEEA